MKILSSKGTLRIDGRYYTVQFGDSLYAISQRFGVTIDNLLSFNDQIPDSATIYPGEILFIPNRDTSKNTSIQARKMKQRQRQLPGKHQHKAKRK